MTPENGRSFKFLRNGEAEPADIDWEKGIDSARQAISEALSAKNIAFLLGAGCSSLMRDGTEVGIPTMSPLAKEFCAFRFAPAEPRGEDTRADDVVEDPNQSDAQTHYIRGEDGAEIPLRPEVCDDSKPQPKDGPAPWRLTTAEVDCLTALGIDLESGYNRNLERLMEVLFSQRFVLRASENSSHWPQLNLINGIIEKVQAFLWCRLTDGAF
jgi:hypothetical protein